MASQEVTLLVLVKLQAGGSTCPTISTCHSLLQSIIAQEVSSISDVHIIICYVK